MSGIQIYNSLTQSKVPFVTDSNVIKWYTCGPTVYTSSHLGHARNYMSFDIIRRILEEYFGYNVIMVQNITDVDDKIIKRANEEGIPFNELARKWENAFLDDMTNLGVKLPTTLTRVSEHIPEIIAFIERLIQKEYAYISNDSVYFDVLKFQETHEYSKISKRCCYNENDDDTENLYRDEKRSPMDFALWKKSKPDEPFWDSPWGRGRPGWHIECSAMASYILGDQMDIHSGGEDLKFPHHDNELAQSEAYHENHQWVRYFMHSGHLGIDGAKMSKSLKNFITIKEALQKYTPRQLRMLFLLHNYNSILEYNENTMEYAVSIDNTIASFLETLRMEFMILVESKWSKNDKDMHGAFLELQSQVQKSLQDNFNTSNVLQLLLGFMSLVHKYIRDNGQSYLVKEIYEYYVRIMGIFGSIYTSSNLIDNLSNELIDILVKFRSNVRLAAKSKNVAHIFKLSDEIRDINLPKLGIKLTDKGEISLWTSSIK